MLKERKNITFHPAASFGSYGPNSPWCPGGFLTVLRFYMHDFNLLNLEWTRISPIIIKHVRHNLNPNTVSILSVGVWLEGKNQFFDTNRKDRNRILVVWYLEMRPKPPVKTRHFWHGASEQYGWKGERNLAPTNSVNIVSDTDPCYHGCTAVHLVCVCHIILFSGSTDLCDFVGAVYFGEVLPDTGPHYFGLWGSYKKRFGQV